MTSHSESINVLALVIGGSRRHASTRYRILQYVPHLAREDITVNILPATQKAHSGIRKLFDKIQEELNILKIARNSDLIFIQKRLFRTGFIKQLKKLSIPIIFDFDDLLVSGGGTGSGWSFFTENKLKKRFESICRYADHIFAGSHFLASMAGRYSHNVMTIPTVIDIDRYAQKVHSGCGKTLVWIGQSRKGDFPQLRQIAPALRNISIKHKDLKLIVVSDVKPDISGVNIEFIQWSEETECHQLSRGDIGISPLPDDRYSKGGCCLKSLQYMACGLPVVCSSSGAHLEIFLDGKHGVLVNDNLNNWELAIDSLLSDPELRNNIGDQGRRRVHSVYSLQSTASKVIQKIKQLVDDKRHENN